MALTNSQAHEVWGVLVEHVGASQDDESRREFVSCVTRDSTFHGCCEYRFQGNLGFGGKLYIERQGLRVSCYKEDETPERLEAIDKANAALAAHWKLWNGD